MSTTKFGSGFLLLVRSLAEPPGLLRGHFPSFSLSDVEGEDWEDRSRVKPGLDALTSSQFGP